MILGILALCAVVILAFPDTPTAQWLHDRLIARPVEWFSNLKRRDIIFAFVLAGLFLTAGEFIVVFGASELLAVAMHLSLYFDAVLVTTAAGVAAAVAGAWRGLRMRFSMWRQRRGVRAHRPRKSRTRKSHDDEDAPSWGAAYAC